MKRTNAISDRLSEGTTRVPPLSGGSTATVHPYKDVLSSLFNFAVDRGLIEKNPIAGYKHRIKRNSRERYLTELEIARPWRACDQVPHVSSDIYKTILLTACRPGEACAHGVAGDPGGLVGAPWPEDQERKEHWI